MTVRAGETNRECECGHGEVIHKKGPCSRWSCECTGFEETMLRRLGERLVVVKKKTMTTKEEQ